MVVDESVEEINERGDGFDVVVIGEGWVVVHVDADDFQSSAHFVANFFENGRQGLTRIGRATPEVHHDRLERVEDFAFERGFIDVMNTDHFTWLWPWRIER